ncbi:MAG: hypothetical protein R8L53_06255, partial [Mariprofundales bacterium]
QAQTAGVNHLLMPSFGTYGVAARVNYFFGFPRTMSAGGIVMDIGKLITTTTPKNGNNDERFGFVLQAGMLSSALEHTVPEQMFSTATQKAEAVSTVKLLNLAAQQDMPILHITPANKAATIPALQLAPEVIAEIQAAVAVGKEVIAHQSNITAFGWTGAGYVVFDPVTGDGAWRISGGGNGAAYIMGLSSAILLMTSLSSGLVGLALALPALLAGLLFVQFLNMDIANQKSGKSTIWGCYVLGLLYGFSAVFLAMSFLGFADSVVVESASASVGIGFLMASIATGGFIKDTVESISGYTLQCNKATWKDF